MESAADMVKFCLEHFGGGNKKSAEKNYNKVINLEMDEDETLEDFYMRFTSEIPLLQRHHQAPLLQSLIPILRSNATDDFDSLEQLVGKISEEKNTLKNMGQPHFTVSPSLRNPLSHCSCETPKLCFPRFPTG